MRNDERGRERSVDEAVKERERRKGEKGENGVAPLTLLP